MSHERKPDRRDFLAATGAVAAACASGTAVNASEQPFRLPGTLYDLTAAEFSELIGQRFRAEDSRNPDSPKRATLVLQQVVPHACDNQRPASIRPEGFSLVFSATGDPQLENDTHRVSGGGLPSCDLLLNETTPPDASRKRYEIVMN